MLYPFVTLPQAFSPSGSNLIKLSSTLWSDLRDIEFSGLKAFGVFYDGMTIVDLKDINSPSQIGQIELPPDN